MSHFYATIPTSSRKTTLTAQGTAHTGITTYTASWKGCIQTRLYEYEGKDWFEVTMKPWRDVNDDDSEPVGDSQVLASGLVGDRSSIVCPLNAPYKRY